MNRYLNEVARMIGKLGVTVASDEEKGMLNVFYQDSPFCEITNDRLRYQEVCIDTDEKKELYNKIRDLRRDITEYINAFENAPPLTAEGLPNGFRLIAEHNRVVLAAKDMGDYGYEFATWDRTYGNTGLTHGHYIYDYPAVKEDFAVRSGLVNKHRIFNDSQMKDIYIALDYNRTENPYVTYEECKAYAQIMDQIECVIPDVESTLDEEQSSGMDMNM